MPGIIACDIDGTLTNKPFDMPVEVQQALKDAYVEGWTIIFITGRPFVWGVKPLQQLDFPYYLAVINGANLLRMPEAQLIEEQLVSKKVLGNFDAFCALNHTDYVAYSGFSGNDICYYRPERFVKTQIEYLKQRSAALGEVWLPIHDFKEVMAEGFASIKCFGDHAFCQKMSQFMEQEIDLHAPTIRDPFNNTHYVAQATHKECTKGHVLKRFAKKMNVHGPIIAAGDDFNDISMFKVADARIVMETAPPAVLEMADYIAPSAEKAGLAEVLPVAINDISRRYNG